MYTWFKNLTVQKSLKYVMPCFMAAMLIFSGCEDMMKKKIDVDLADFPPKLAVTASLDTDKGSFTLTLYEGYSLASYSRNGSGYQSVIKAGSVQLYQDGQLIWSLAGAFDLSIYKNYYDGSGDDVHRNINITGLPVKTGSTYRLEINIDGYQKAIATAIMPDPPVIDNASIDLDNSVKKNNVNKVTRSWYGGYLFYPVTCTLSDHSSERDYYALRIYQYQNTDDPDYSYTSYNLSEMGIGVSNPTIIQDNPDIEAQNSLFDDNSVYDLYWFNVLLLSDLTFSGKSAALELYTTNENYIPAYRQRPSNYNPAIHGREVIFDNKWEIKIGHISAEMFRHYRSLLLQEDGMDFFAEPVLIVSNVENGYGCFSLQNSHRVVLKEYKTYYYPEWRTYPYPDEPYYF